MAQLNCPTCYNGMFIDQWGNICQDPQRSGSNVSLNMPPAGYPMQMNPMWMNPMGTWHGASPNMMGMFPYPMNMPMNPNSQDSRTHSRAASPTPSIKSRKSHVSRASRKYREDSDEEDNSVFSYADKSDRKSVRDRAERIKAKKDSNKNEDRREKRITSPEKREKMDDRLERMSIHSRRDSDDLRSDRESSRERRERSIKEDIFERVSLRNGHSSEKHERKPSLERRRGKLNDDSFEKTSIRSKQKNISSESDDYKSDSQKETSLESEVESKESEDKPEEIEAPVVTQVPDIEWECEHCTFVNPAGTRVCTICCKTPTLKAKIIKVTNTPEIKPKTSTKVSSGTNTQLKDKKKHGKLELEEPVFNHINEAYEGLNSKSKVSETQKKGRTLRKITFWPGTKFPPFYK